MGAANLMTLYVDMDGVITAFQKKLSETLGRPVEKEFKDPKIWAIINKRGKNFWASMEWMEDGKKLWEGLKKYDPTILSAPTNHPSSVEGKKEWLKENLPGVPFIIEQKKDKYADKNSILIDDREKNIKKWEEAGGIGILHKDAETTLEKLKKIMATEKNATMEQQQPRQIKPWIPKGIRGGRSQKVIPPKKGGPYQRNKDLEREVKASFIVAGKLRKIASIITSEKE